MKEKPFEEQFDWIDGQYRPRLLYVKGSKTSLDAALSNTANSTQRERVYRAIQRAGKRGMTDEEIQIALDMNPNTQRPRRVELQHIGLIKDSMDRRKTKARRDAAVWIVRLELLP